MALPDQLDLLRSLVDFGMLVLIWLVQLIIYPSFRYCDPRHFKTWHHRYTGLISLFVAPLMFTQSGIYAWLVFTRGVGWDWAGGGLLLVNWAATFLLSIPCHDRLQKDGFDLATIDRLVGTNWIRTAAWTVMSLASLLVVWQSTS